MIIISHRGYWRQQNEKNSELAFRHSFNLGFGTETDVRDCMGRLVISHDMPNGSEMEFQSFVALAAEQHQMLAINVKADGLAVALSKIMQVYDPSRWFVFDMSIPDMRSHLDVGNPVFARMSEVERYPAWLDRVSGIWLDSFDETWFNSTLIFDLVGQGKRVCVVSPELHGRDPKPLWEQLRSLANCMELILCTDVPEDARHYFFGDLQ